MLSINFFVKFFSYVSNVNVLKLPVCNIIMYYLRREQCCSVVRASGLWTHRSLFESRWVPWIFSLLKSWAAMQQKYSCTDAYITDGHPVSSCMTLVIMGRYNSIRTVGYWRNLGCMGFSGVEFVFYVLGIIKFKTKIG